MFLDTKGKKPKISLGGKSKLESKADIINKTRQKREERNHQKKEIRSCTSIQKFIRGRLIYFKEKESARMEFDQILKQNKNRIENAELRKLCRLILFFYNSQIDFDRVSEISDFFANDSNLWRLWTNEEITATRLDQDLVHMAHFISLCLELSLNNEYILSNVLNILQKIIKLHESQLALQIGFENTKFLQNSIIFELCVWKNPKRTNLLSFFSKYLIRENNLDEEKIILKGQIWQIIFLTLGINEDGSVQIFNVPFASKQNKIYRIFSETLLPLVNSSDEALNLFFTKMASGATEGWWKLFSITQTLGNQWETEVLTNILNLKWCPIKGPTWNFSISQCNLYLSALVHLSSMIDLQSLYWEEVNELTSQETKSNETNDGYLNQDSIMGIDGLYHLAFSKLSPSSKQFKNYNTSGLLKITEVVQSNIYNLTSNLLATNIFEFAFSQLDQFSTNEQKFHAVQTIQKLSGLLSEILLHTRTRTDKMTSLSTSNILNGFAFSNPSQFFLKRFWKLIIQPAIESPQPKAFLNPTFISSFSFFCMVFFCQLLVVTDNEIFMHDTPFSIFEIFDIIISLKRLLFELIWTNPITEKMNIPSLPNEIYFCANGAVLFNELHIRLERRRNLYDPNIWLWPNEIEKELVQSNKSTNLENLVTSTEEDVFPFTKFIQNPKMRLILTTIPQVVSFKQRALLFQKLVEQDRGRNQSNFFTSSSDLQVQRQSIYEDTFANSSQYILTKNRMKIVFRNEHGLVESGIDGGGVFKEFIDLLTKRAFNPEFGFFCTTGDQRLYPNPLSSSIFPDYETHFEFMGKILGKAIYESILVEPQFTDFFLNNFLGRTNRFEDLISLDYELYRNLAQLKELVLKGHNLEELDLTFSYNVDCLGKVISRELIENGSSIPVTNQNYLKFIHYMARYKLNKEIEKQCKAFLRGFRSLIPEEWIRMFSTNELQLLIGGQKEPIDFENLKQFIGYSGGYYSSHPYIQWFWEIIQSFTTEEQHMFLAFVTSCPRQPLLGFGHLHPPMTIQKVPNDPQFQRLPTASTCVNLLKLPEYPNKETLKKKLLDAILAGAGFELT